MKKSLFIFALALVLNACDKAEQSNQISSSDKGQKSSIQKIEIQKEHIQNIDDDTSNISQNQNSIKSNESSLTDKAIIMAGEKSELFKKSIQMMDIWSLQNAMNKNGMKADDGIKWQARLAQAKNEQEVKSILNEQINHLTIIVNELEKIQLRDPQVIAIKDGLKNGAQSILNAEKQFLMMDLTDPNINSKLTPFTQEILQGGQMVMKANDDFIKLVNSLGFKTNEEAVAYYEHYKEQFEQFKQSQ